MPVFQYDAYRNPFGPSIAEALAHQADPQAAAALRRGDIEARAAERTGTLRAQQFSALGAIPGAIQAQRAEAQQQAARAQQLEIGGLQLDVAKRDAKTRNVMDAELRNPANRNADGSLNDDRFMQALQQQDVGAWQQYGALAAKNTQARLELLKTTSEITKNVTDADEKAQKVRDAQIAFLSKGALSAVDALDQKPGDPLHARDTANSYIADGIASGAITPTQGQQFLLRTAQAAPDQLRGVFLQMTDPELRAKVAKDQAEANKPIDVAAGGTLVSRPNPNAPGAPPTVYYTAPPKDTVKPGTAEDWVARARRLATGQNGGVPLTDAQLQTVDTAALSSFKAANADQDLRDAALAQRNIAAALAQLQLNQTPTPAQAASVAEDLVNHRLAPEQLASLFSTRGREGLAFKLAVSAEAKKLDPQFNFEEASSNYQLVKSPGFQNTVRYIDSVQESMPRLLQTATKLGTGQFHTFNELANAAKGQFNDTDLKRFKVDALLVGDEVAKLLSGGGSGSATSDAKLKQASELISAADSVPAVAAALQEIQTLIGYRRQALTRGTYLEGTRAGGGREPAAVAAPAKGEVRTANGERRMWDGTAWVRVK